MVKPGGTGRPMRHISARFAPLPPSSGFIVPLPSVLRPKRYTYLPAPFAADAVALGFGLWPFGRDDCLRDEDFLASFFAITCAVLLTCRESMSDVRCSMCDVRC